MPYLLSIFPVSLSFRLTDHFASQDIFQPQLMFGAVKFRVILVYGIVCQMDVRVIKAFIGIVFFSCQSHEAVVIQKDCHRTYDRGYQNIYTKVILVTIIECRPLNIFLNYVLILRLFNLTCHEGFSLLLSRRMRISLHRVNTLFDFQIFIHFLPVVFICLIQLHAHLFNLRRNENATALWSRFGFTNVEHNRF